MRGVDALRLLAGWALRRDDRWVTPSRLRLPWRRPGLPGRASKRELIFLSIEAPFGRSTLALARAALGE